MDEDSDIGDDDIINARDKYILKHYWCGNKNPGLVILRIGLGVIIDPIHSTEINFFISSLHDIRSRKYTNAATNKKKTKYLIISPQEPLARIFDLCNRIDLKRNMTNSKYLLGKALTKKYFFKHINNIDMLYSDISINKFKIKWEEKNKCVDRINDMMNKLAFKKLIYKNVERKNVLLDFLLMYYKEFADELVERNVIKKCTNKTCLGYAPIYGDNIDEHKRKDRIRKYCTSTCGKQKYNKRIPVEETYLFPIYQYPA